MGNIKRYIPLCSLWGPILCAVIFFGCIPPQESADDSQSSYDEMYESNNSNDEYAGSEKQSYSGFNVQSDTLTVQSKKKRNKNNSSPINVRATAGKFYTIQVGAFKLKENADKNYNLSIQRFKEPVIKFFDPKVELERICVGHFTTVKAAKEFIKSIQQQFPNEYNDVWISTLNHE